MATAAGVLFAVDATAAIPVTPSTLGVFQAACVGVPAVAGVASGDGLSYGLLPPGREFVSAVLLGVPSSAIERTGARAVMRGA